jgi:hypothetical protein
MMEFSTSRHGFFVKKADFSGKFHQITVFGVFGPEIKKNEVEISNMSGFDLSPEIFAGGELGVEFCCHAML